MARLPDSPPSLLQCPLVAGGAVWLALFVWVERRAAEPVIPPWLSRNDVFAVANLATLAVAVAMFGAIYYIPVFVQACSVRASPSRRRC